MAKILETQFLNSNLKMLVVNPLVRYSLLEPRIAAKNHLKSEKI